jgi:YD repeat-containing protein
MLFYFWFFAKRKSSRLKSLLLNIFILLNFCAAAQILDLNKPLFSDEPFFNSNFIRLNKIKSIKGSRSSKKVKDIIRTKGLDFYYEFNTAGNLTMQISTFHDPKLRKDTNVINYYYDKTNNLTLIRKNDTYGYYSHEYSYDKSGGINKQTYCREENLCDAKNYFQLGNRYVIMSDSFSYQQLSDKQIKKTFYNNYKKPYKEQIDYNNELGYLTEEYTKFLIGNKKHKTTYQYDEKGRVIKIITNADLNTPDTSTEEFYYDELGNILEIKIYENSTYKISKQFLYDKKTFLLTAQLIQEVETEFIKIIQYQYTFYSGESTNLTIENQ